MYSDLYTRQSLPHDSALRDSFEVLGCRRVVVRQDTFLASNLNTKQINPIKENL